MLGMFYPYKRIESVYDFDFKALYDEGFRGLIFDIDNTLVFHDAIADNKAINLFKDLHKIGFRIGILSNNSELRVSPFAKKVNADCYISKAKKPIARGYNQIIRKMDLEIDNVAFFGDQLLTDILGANRLGIRTYVVHKLGDEEDSQIKFKRKIENIIYYFYDKKNRRDDKC